MRYKQKYSSSLFPRLPKVMTVPGNLPLPPLMKTKFYLTTKGSMTITSGSQSNITITGNSLFDPFSTFGSNQPQMFDELSNFYNRYEVLWSKLEVTFGAGDDTNETDCWIVPTQNSSATLDFSSSHLMPGFKATALGSNAAGGSIRKLSGYYNSSVMYGKDRGSDDLGAAVTANPAAVWYWRISTSPMLASSTSTYTISVTVSVTYCAVLSQIKYLAIT